MLATFASIGTGTNDGDECCMCNGRMRACLGPAENMPFGSRRGADRRGRGYGATQKPREEYANVNEEGGRGRTMARAARPINDDTRAGAIRSPSEVR